MQLQSIKEVWRTEAKQSGRSRRSRAVRGSGESVENSRSSCIVYGSAALRCPGCIRVYAGCYGGKPWCCGCVGSVEVWVNEALEGALELADRMGGAGD